MLQSRVVFSFVVLLGMAPPAWLLHECGAAEWSAEPSIRVRGEYNSNLLYTSMPHEEVWGVWVSPGVTFAGSTENLELSGRAAADFVHYYGGQDISLTNLYFPLNVRYRTERDQLSFEGGFTRDNTLLGELRQTGVVLTFTQRNLWTANPSWAHQLTERFSVQAGYQFADATYENGLQLGLVDYQVQGGNAGVSYEATEKSRMKLNGVYTNFHAPDANGLRSVIYGADLSYDHSFSETLVAGLSGGPRLVSSSINNGPSRVTDDQTVWVGNGRIEKKFEKTVLRLEASQEIYPSGFGLLLQTDRVGVFVSGELTERLRTSLYAQAYWATGIASAATATVFPESRYINVTPTVSWRLGEWWALDASYTYGRRDVDSLNQTGISNSVYLSLTYFPPKLSVSR